MGQMSDPALRKTVRQDLWFRGRWRRLGRRPTVEAMSAGAAMSCSACGTANRPGRRFCSRCGAPLARACGACGFVNEPGDGFCGGCGQRLVSSTEP